jgi:ribosomal protein S12 methylthiotransferase accessory factor
MTPSRNAARSRAEIRKATLDGLARQIGVSRVARVTGLDRGGVEVACAIRPGGHVLQVSNGKGLDAQSARAGALLEAAELWAAENPDPSRLVVASFSELEAQGIAAWPFAEELLGDAPFSPALRIAWIEARVLAAPPTDRLHSNHWHTNHLRGRDRTVLVPAALVHCVSANGPWLGPAVHRWTSNGMGAHPDGELALRHALLEAAERDGLSRALPHGFRQRDLQRRKLDPSSLVHVAPRVAALIAQLGVSGLTAHLFDLRPERTGARWMGLMLAGALLIDDDAGPIPLAAGYACASTLDGALSGALLEAAQSRLTDVHGAREDIDAADRDASRALAQAANRASPRTLLDARELQRGLEESSAQLTERFVAAGFTRVAAIDLAPRDLAARVLKIVAPGLRLSELL